ncbi:Asp/Glu racemase [Maritimibacter sp. 55A14]|uniref:maleate cis-trans isomerase family protein n=1 Tax=Maritimibacter sp. 55A14 TaxID=2174844 RepID=UPI000D61DAF1|nr:aspartate/glutamate racemase family protein [Maritimibacter sp. 55A14]PWE32416.1 Asp/Glu racemase [Maritimibacter sp. 55A14]
MARDYTLDNGYGTTARLGMIVLSTDETIENEARRVMDRPGISLLHARIPAHADVTPQTLALMEAEMPGTAALLPAGLDAVAYACTSGATVIGSDVVARHIQSAHPDAAVTDPAVAVTAALEALGARRIALVTPYLASVTEPIRARLKRSGIETVAEQSFGEKDDWTVARITEAATLDAIRAAAGEADCDAIFASCTNLRSFGIIETAERELGLPVISSNLALVWHLLRLAGVEARGWGPGRLFGV